jgi:hypothetical protein
VHGWCTASDSPPVMGATRLIVLLAGISKILKPAAARPGDTAPPPELYGLVRVHDLPSLPALVKVNVSSGQLKFVGGGGGLNTTAGTGDLVAIHQRSRRYYYLGGGAGPRLVAVSLDTGRELCGVSLPSLQEIDCVGCGQTLSLVEGEAHGALLISGIGRNASAADPYHTLLRLPLPAPDDHGSAAPFSACPGPIELVGHFGMASFTPMAHASEIDPVSQQLFLTLSTSAHSYGIGVVNTSDAHLDVIDEDSARSRSMVGMSWQRQSGKLVGVAQDATKPALSFRTLQPVGSGSGSGGTWTAQPLGLDPSLNLTQGPLYGNLGSVRAFDDRDGGLLWVLTMMRRGGGGPDAGRGSDGGGGGLYVVGVDPYLGSVVSAAPLHGDKGISGEVLLQMAILPAAVS